ncbi:MAG: beta-ketoacyl synthase N-terminal-like domain-containing protein, partial [Myxococcota bacterium]
ADPRAVGGRMSPKQADVVVTGIGVRCAVGNDVVQTAATIRTRLSRFVAWEHGAVAADEEPIAVAPIDPDLGDCPWSEKLAGLIEQPVHEALWQARLYDGVGFRARFGTVARIGLWAATPSPTRPRAGVREVEDVAARLATVLPLRPDGVEVVALDHGAGLTAIARAAEAIATRRCMVAVVVGADSHLHAPWLEMLVQRDWAKHESRPHGFVPGECGTCVVLERAETAARRDAVPLARLAAVAVDHEARPIGPEEPVRAEGLSRVVHSCLDAVPELSPALAVADLNGERWRSLEWALMKTRCLGRLGDFALLHPSDCVGDVGAAGGGLHVATAIRALERGYSGGESVLLTSSSPLGPRAAAVLATAGS